MNRLGRVCLFPFGVLAHIDQERLRIFGQSLFGLSHREFFDPLFGFVNEFQKTRCVVHNSSAYRSGVGGTISVCSAKSAARMRVSGKPSSLRTMFVPCAIAAVLKNAISRLHPCRPKPQSLETMSCSGAI